MNQKDLNISLTEEKLKAIRSKKYRITLLQVDTVNPDGSTSPFYANAVYEDAGYDDLISIEQVLSLSNVEELLIKGGILLAESAGFNLPDIRAAIRGNPSIQSDPVHRSTE